MKLTPKKSAVSAADATRALSHRERLFASMLWRQGGLSRRDLHEQTQTHPTLTGNAVAALIERGLIKEGPGNATPARGRPQVPLLVNAGGRSFLGIAIAPGEVRVVRTNALGEPIDGERCVDTRSGNPVAAAATLLTERLDPSIAGVGVSITGLVLPREQRVLFSSSLPTSESVSICPIFAAAGDVPVTVENDVHALAVRWQLSQKFAGGDVLLVGIEDGRLGASLLLNSRPMGGEISGANELGHTRLNVDTAPCYCGRTGCLERIVSTAQLRRFGGVTRRSLAAVLADPAKDRRAVERVLHHLADGLANAVNFVRPRLLIIASPFLAHALSSEILRTQVPARVLPGLRDRVDLRFWAQSNVQSADNAAWLALAEVFGQPALPME